MIHLYHFIFILFSCWNWIEFARAAIFIQNLLLILMPTPIVFAFQMDEAEHLVAGCTTLLQLVFVHSEFLHNLEHSSALLLELLSATVLISWYHSNSMFFGLYRPTALDLSQFSFNDFRSLFTLLILITYWLFACFISFQSLIELIVEALVLEDIAHRYLP